MKPKSQRLQIVQQQAEQRESEAAASLRQCQARLAAEMAQLDQLTHYYTDYLQQINDQSQVSVEELMRYRGFSQSLASSVRQFDRKVVATRHQLDQLTQQWSLLRHKRRAIDELIQQARREEQSREDKQLQKVNDELVNQRYQRHLQDNE